MAIFNVVAGVEPQSETKSFHTRHRYKIEGGGGGASTGPAVSAMVVGHCAAPEDLHYVGCSGSL